MSLYDHIRAKALETYGNEEEAEQFVNGFMTKAAGIWDASGKEYSLGSSVIKGTGESLGRSVVGGVASLGIAGIGAIAGAIKDHGLYNKFLNSLNEVMRTNSVVKEADKKKVIDFGNTIFKFAPHVATDPNLLSTILSNAIHGESIDPTTIKTLMELESRFREMKTFDHKAWM